MSWELPNSPRKKFTTSTPNYLFFKAKFQEVKNLNSSKIIIALTNYQNKRETKACGFCMQRIALIINQTKGNIKDKVRRFYQYIVQKYHRTCFHIVKNTLLDYLML